MIRKILAVLTLAAAATCVAVPALASVHVPFYVVVNGGATVTREPLVAGQVITCGGVAHTVDTVRASYGTYTITLTPRLGASAVCST